MEAQPCDALSLPSTTLAEGPRPRGPSSKDACYIADEPEDTFLMGSDLDASVQSPGVVSIVFGDLPSAGSIFCYRVFISPVCLCAHTHRDADMQYKHTCVRICMLFSVCSTHAFVCITYCVLDLIYFLVGETIFGLTQGRQVLGGNHSGGVRRG